MIFKIINNIRRAAKHYDKVYIAVDIHGTILKPRRFGISNEWYPNAQETLKMMSRNPRICLIMWTASHDDAIEKYLSFFRKNGITFQYVNENPECDNNEYACFNNKIYMDAGLDDKFGFNPYTGWFFLKHFMNFQFF